jgi:hypothetical protein
MAEAPLTVSRMRGRSSRRLRPEDLLGIDGACALPSQMAGEVGPETFRMLHCEPQLGLPSGMHGRLGPEQLDALEGE